VHIVQRGHSRKPVFFDDADYFAYLNWLKAGALRYKVAVHAYVLMTNHIHILATPTEVEGILSLMRRLQCLLC
jgi:putative transposase